MNREFTVADARLAVCVATRGRTNSLLVLLNALERIQAPVGTQTVVVVVENDRYGSLREEVQRRSRAGHKFMYGLEPRMGIPFARNLALRLAMTEGADYIAFIDDDEVPEHNWLAALWDKVRTGQYDLVGGPVEPFVSDTPRSWFSRQIWFGLLEQSDTSRKKAMCKSLEGLEHTIFVPTSNWMVRSDFVRQHALEFDESMGFSGGTDLKFYRELVRIGGRVGWTDAALVKEGLSHGRLTIGYQYRRARDQAVSNFHVRHPRITVPLFFRGLIYSLGKLITAFFWLILLPLYRGKALLRSVKGFGQAVGRWHAIHNRYAEHYRTVV